MLEDQQSDAKANRFKSKQEIKDEAANYKLPDAGNVNVINRHLDALSLHNWIVEIKVKEELFIFKNVIIYMLDLAQISGLRFYVFCVP